MRLKFSGLSIYCLIYLFFPIYAWSASPLDKDNGCVSNQCHSKMSDQSNVHPSNVECKSCHEGNEVTHPEKTGEDFTLLNIICIKCHESIMDFANLHAPVAAGDCRSCHLTHGQKENYFLPVQDKIVCYDCHERIINKKDKYFHDEISDGKCSSCHAVHGSSFPNLLLARYSPNFFNDYSNKHYEICFKCHKEDLLLHPRTSFNTKFRANKKNLHYVHTNKKNKGISCNSCHKTHASQLPHLMANSVSFGNWKMPINFQPTENGGKCLPGCHKTASYDRRRK